MSGDVLKTLHAYLVRRYRAADLMCADAVCHGGTEDVIRYRDERAAWQAAIDIIPSATIAEWETQDRIEEAARLRAQAAALEGDAA